MAAVQSLEARRRDGALRRRRGGAGRARHHRRPHPGGAQRRRRHGQHRPRSATSRSGSPPPACRAEVVGFRTDESQDSRRSPDWRPPGTGRVTTTEDAAGIGAAFQGVARSLSTQVARDRRAARGRRRAAGPHRQRRRRRRQRDQRQQPGRPARPGTAPPPARPCRSRRPAPSRPSVPVWLATPWVAVGDRRPARPRARPAPAQPRAAAPHADPDAAGRVLRPGGPARRPAYTRSPRPRATSSRSRCWTPRRASSSAAGSSAGSPCCSTGPTCRGGRTSTSCSGSPPRWRRPRWSSLLTVGWVARRCCAPFVGLVRRSPPSCGCAARRRMNRFAAQLPDALALVASSLQTGFSLNQALEAISRDTADPLRGQIARAVAETRLGADLEDCLDQVGAPDGLRRPGLDRDGDPDPAPGGRQPRRDAADHRRRRCASAPSLRRHVRALSAEGRLSAYVLIALPIVADRRPDRRRTRLHRRCCGRTPLGIADARRGGARDGRRVALDAQGRQGGDVTMNTAAGRRDRRRSRCLSSCSSSPSSWASTETTGVARSLEVIEQVHAASARSPSRSCPPRERLVEPAVRAAPAARAAAVARAHPGPAAAAARLRRQPAGLAAGAAAGRQGRRPVRRRAASARSLGRSADGWSLVLAPALAAVGFWLPDLLVHNARSAPPAGHPPLAAPTPSTC